MEYLQAVKVIFNLLGGQRFLLMTQSSIFYGKNKENKPYLKFSLPDNLSKGNRINSFIVSYGNSKGLFNISFISTQNSKNFIIDEINQVNAEDILPIFEQETGFTFCSLGPN